MAACMRMLLLSVLMAGAVRSSPDPNFWKKKDTDSPDALVRKLGIVLYPPTCREAFLVRHVLLTSAESLRKAKIICADCNGKIAFRKEMLVAPHDGTHWMHTRCYFQLINNYLAAEKEPVCTSCPANIIEPLQTVLKTLSFTATDSAIEESALPHTLFVLPSTSELGAHACALLKDTLVVLRNILKLRKTYNYTGKIFNVYVDLTGLDSAEAIITHIVASTKYASVLDVYLATIMPPTQSIYDNRALYLKCTEWLDKMDGEPSDSRFSKLDRTIARFVITQLTHDWMYGRMARPLGVLGITKESVEERVTQRQLRVVVTGEVEVTATVTGDVWVEDGAGGQAYIGRLTTRSTRVLTEVYNTDMTNMGLQAIQKGNLIKKAKAEALVAAKKGLIKQGMRALSLLQEKVHSDGNSEQVPSDIARLGANVKEKDLYITALVVNYDPEIKWIYKNPSCLDSFFDFSSEIDLLRRTSNEETSAYM